MKRALEGIRVLDFTHFVAGPWATSLLADFGADVIKVEDPASGDGSRHLDRAFGPGMSSYFVGMNRGKRSLALDLKRPESQEAIHRLLETTDVLIANFRPGVLDRLGLGYPALAARYPRLLYVSLTAFGESGPLADRPAMDIIVQAAGGVMGLTGEAGRAPVKVGAPVADFTGSYMAFGAIALGLFARERDGKGQLIELNLLDGQVSMLANFMVGHALTGRPEGPQGGGHPQIVPYQVFRSADGFIVVGCLTQDFWLALCQELGRPDLAADPRFASNAERVNHRSALVPELEAAFLERSSDAWLQALRTSGVPCGPVHSVREVAAHPQVRANGMVIETQHPLLGPLTVVGNPLHLRATPPRARSPRAAARRAHRRGAARDRASG